MIVEKVKVVELTLEDGSKMICRGGEEAVLRQWGTIQQCLLDGQVKKKQCNGFLLKRKSIMIDLFQKIDFKSHSGLDLTWKIEMDALTPNEWDCISL